MPRMVSTGHSCRIICRDRDAEFCAACICRIREARESLSAWCEGRVLDVAVDVRVGSPTFGRHVAVELGDDTFRQLWVPRGFAHGFVVLSESCGFFLQVR